MATNDDMLREREQTSRGFTRLMAAVIVLVIIILGGRRGFLV